MKDSHDLCKDIANELAAVESELGKLREKQRTLESQRDRLKTAQSVLREFQGKKSDRTRPQSESKMETPKSKNNARFFNSEGHTVKLVRFLYGKRSGSAVVEAAKFTGVTTRRTRTAFERLRGNGLMNRSGNEYVLTPKGIAAWEDSPLFGKGGANA